MGNIPTSRGLFLNSIGFDRLMSTVRQLESAAQAAGAQKSYPPYNIIKESDTKYQIQVAIAGFSPGEIELTSEHNKLTVVGKSGQAQEKEYLHKGIATRDFVHHFHLADTVVVRSADMKHGMLLINLEDVVPEEKQLRKIPIDALTA